MGLGLSVGRGDFIPYCKFDARAGRWFTKTPDGDVDITDNFTAVFDLEQIEIGWVLFASGVAPIYVTQDVTLGMPPKPASGDFKEGFKLNIALPSSVASGGPRELSSTAKALISVMDAMHEKYTEAPERAEGKLPVLKMSGTTAVETKGPNGTARNYSPNLEIASWVDRPASLPKRGAPVVSAPAAPATPPSTGSKAVPPPAAKKAAGIDLADFG